MLTKWGNALGLAAAGRTVTAGGGSTPLGDATVWPNQLLWSDLFTLPAGNLRSGDRCLVTGLGTSGSSGFAQYDGTDWKLIQGVFSSLANLALFTELVETGAIIAIGTGIETDPYYYYDGSQWLRTPDGVHYIWKNITDWAGLSALDNSLNNDEAEVNTLGTSHSSGTAQKHGGSSWRLINGKFDTVSDMTLFDTANDVATDAIALVKSGGGHDENAVPYTYRSGNWIRLADNALGFAWTLSSLRDFSPANSNGALQEGDYGFYGNTLYRYNSAVPISGGGTDAMWLPPAVYAGTLSIRGRIVGTEAIGAIGVVPIVVGGITFAAPTNPTPSSTVTQSGDYIQFQTATNTGNIIYGSALFTMGSAIRTYMQCDISVSYSGLSGAIARVLSSEGNAQPAWWFHLGPSGSISPLPSFTTGTALQGSQDAIRDGGIAWPSTSSGNYSTTELIDAGRNVATECFRDGISYHRSRRSSTNSGTATPSAGVGFFMQANSFGAGGTLTFRVKNWRILTW